MPNFGFHLVLTSFHLEFLSFWISRLFDLSDLSVLKNGSLKYFENGLESMQTFQRLMGGMNRRQRSHLNQIRSAVRSARSWGSYHLRNSCKIYIFTNTNPWQFPTLSFAIQYLCYFESFQYKQQIGCVEILVFSSQLTELP